MGKRRKRAECHLRKGGGTKSDLNNIESDGPMA